MSPDRKIKKIEPSIHLGIDSPMVIFHGELDELTGEGGRGPTEPGGPTGESKAPVGSKQGPVHGYLAMCDQTTHPDHLDGVQSGGSWAGPHQLRFEDALGDKASHRDGSAYVVLHVGTVFIGPLTSPV